MNLLKTALASALLALAATGAQAAHLQLVDATGFGSSQTQLMAADGDSLAFNGTVDALPGLADLLATGSGTDNGMLAASGLVVDSTWLRQATLDASGPVTRFQATGSTSLGFTGTADLADGLALAEVGLTALLRVASDGEAPGSAVQVRLQLSAESLFSSTVASAEDTPTFSLLVQDDAFNTLASYNGVPLNLTDTLDLHFHSAVGQTLSLSLQYANALSFGNTAINGVQGIESSALLDGTLTVTAVPEPQTTALLLAGLAALAALAHRRR